VRGAWGTLLLTLLVSSAGHTFLVTARFCSGRTFGATPWMLQSMPSNSRLAASQARKSESELTNPSRSNLTTWRETLTSTSGNRRCDRSSRTSRAPSVNMRFGREQRGLAGPMTGL
jgi:hypothetical protein